MAHVILVMHKNKICYISDTSLHICAICETHVTEFLRKGDLEFEQERTPRFIAYYDIHSFSIKHSNPI